MEKHMLSITSRLCLSSMLLVSMVSTQSLVNASENTEANGLIMIKSTHSVSETINRLETALKNKGMTIFTRIDHTAGAAKVDLQLRPTELLIFGNPKVGTPLMLCSQTAAIDLPQKALAYEDESGQVWLAYNDPAYMAKRHNTQGCEQAIQKVSNALANFTEQAAE
jgi:uncharacterized protein (DUF302 family)